MADQNQRPLRADAKRNRELIMDAAVASLGDNPRASMSTIAAVAGVGRVTLYGHFSSREELVEAVFSRALDRAEEVLAEIDLDHDPTVAMERLVIASWQVINESRLLLQAAEEELGPKAIRRYHEQLLVRVQDLIARGRESGAFRTDLSQAWLIACFYAILHGAAQEVREGRLHPDGADRVVWATIRSLICTGAAS